mgnify:FL=1
MNRKNHAKKFGFRQWLVIALCLMLMMPMQPTFANKYSEFETVELKDRATGQFKSYEPVNIMVYGKDLFSDTPGVIVNSRTLVPVSAILKELGVAYEWKAQTEEVLFAYNGKNIVLKIDSPYAMVNGVKTLLPDSVPPKIMTYKSTTGELVGRTYVPLAFISEMLGLDRSWIAETRTVAINKKAQSLTDA